MQGPFQLGDLTVRPDLNRIELGDDTFPIEPMVMDVLCLLADRAGEVVSRDELLDHIWKDRYGADASLTRAISLLRRTLRDAGVEEDWIVTVPKRGYRLAVTPERREPTPTQAVMQADRRSRAGAILGLTAAAVLLGIVAWRFWPTVDDAILGPSAEVPGAAVLERRSIAVLPLVNRSEAEDAYLTDALHDEILAQLARIGSMKVISRTSVMRYEDPQQPVSEIAAELGVRHLVEGGVLRSGDRIRVTVQLIDAQTDDHLWAEVYDRELSAETLFAIQGEIALAIARTLDAQLTPAERSRVAHRPTQDFAAYQAVLLGRQAFLRRTSDRVAALERALEHFDRALALEPDYADALAGKAAVYAVWDGYLVDEPDGRRRRLAIDHARRALALDPLQANAHAVLGLVAESARERFEHLERARSLAPSDATARFWTALNHLVAGHLQRGVERLRQAQELDPTYPIVNQWLAVTADFRGDAEAARAHADQGIAMGMTAARGLLGTMSLRAGDLDQARAYFQAVVPPAEWGDWVDHVLAAGETAARTPQVLRAIIGPEDGNSIPHFRIAVLAAAGAHDAALDLIAQRVPVDITAFAYAWHRANPEFRRDPRFDDLARSLGLPEYWRNAGFPPGCEPVGDEDFRCGP